MVKRCSTRDEWANLGFGLRMETVLIHSYIHRKIEAQIITELPFSNETSFSIRLFDIMYPIYPNNNTFFNTTSTVW